MTLCPEVLHVIFTLLGLGLGWYVRHHSLGIAPEVLSVVQQLLSTQKQQQAHSLLQDLLGQVVPPLSPPPANPPRS
jgi:hypothetical protein